MWKMWRLRQSEDQENEALVRPTQVRCRAELLQSCSIVTNGGSSSRRPLNAGAPGHRSTSETPIRMMGGFHTETSLGAQSKVAQVRVGMQVRIPTLIKSALAGAFNSESSADGRVAGQRVGSGSRIWSQTGRNQNQTPAYLQQNLTEHLA